MQTTEKILRAKEIKVTPQRMAVYGFLNNNKEHPNVEQIYEQLSHDYPTMSLATVYKTVDVLKKVGLINEINVGDGGMRYDAEIRPHSHVYCESCGRVEDLLQTHFHMEFSEDRLLRNVEEKSGFNITSLRLYFYGLCPLCKND